MRVALDLLGGDRAPDAIVDGALRAAQDPDVKVLLVGPVTVSERLLAERGATGQVTLVDAGAAIGMGDEPARALRSTPDATVLVAARLVRDGRADALVSMGPTGATLAAAVLTLGRVVRRPALAVVIPSASGPVVLLDAGASSDSTPAHLVDHAGLGRAYARALGVAEPRIGLLNVGEEPGKGDLLRKEAFAALADVDGFVGNVEGHDVPLGGRADVVVTDGFTGNVLLKGIEGASRRAGAADLPVSALLLGVRGVVVVGHGAAEAQDVLGCLRAAVVAHRGGLAASQEVDA